MTVKKGDKVRITRMDVSGIRCPYGRVVRTDGFLVYVRPVWHRWIMELYQNEVTLAELIWDTKKQKPNIKISKVKKKG